MPLVTFTRRFRNGPNHWVNAFCWSRKDIRATRNPYYVAFPQWFQHGLYETVSMVRSQYGTSGNVSAVSTAWIACEIVHAQVPVWDIWKCFGCFSMHCVRNCSLSGPCVAHQQMSRPRQRGLHEKLFTLRSKRGTSGNVSAVSAWLAWDIVHRQVSVWHIGKCFGCFSMDCMRNCSQSGPSVAHQEMFRRSKSAIP